jgi:hypothetical protein
MGDEVKREKKTGDEIKKEKVSSGIILIFRSL